MPLTKVQPSMAGGGSGTESSFSTNAPIIENTQVVSTNYCITTGTNALSAGPVTISNNVIITIPNGSVWTIV